MLRILLAAVVIGATAVGAVPAIEGSHATPLASCSGYINSDGQCIPDPSAPGAAGAPGLGLAGGGGPPAGATAVCRDGDYSYSTHHTGTCSGHGGVSQWLSDN
jgi:hypothetical protein